MNNGKQKFIVKATEDSHGKFREKAESSGAYSREQDHDGGKLVRQNSVHKIDSVSNKTIRHSMYGEKE